MSVKELIEQMLVMDDSDTIEFHELFAKLQGLLGEMDDPGGFAGYLWDYRWEDMTRDERIKWFSGYMSSVTRYMLGAWL